MMSTVVYIVYIAFSFFPDVLLMSDVDLAACPDPSPPRLYAPFLELYYIYQLLQFEPSELHMSSLRE